MSYLIYLTKFFLLAAVICFSTLRTASATTATFISVTYTGIADSITWQGNYNPILGPSIGSGGGGSLGSSTFTATFNFTVIGEYPVLNNGVSGKSGDISFDIYKDPIIRGSFFATSHFSSLISFDTSATRSAFDTASAGITSQSSIDQILYHASSGAVGITAYSPDIPADIFASYQITDGLSGSGTAVFDYADYRYGGGQLMFELTPEAISVSVSSISDAVPEPSTWVMLLIGFVGVGLMTYRRATITA
jgi:hypothetical protein